MWEKAISFIRKTDYLPACNTQLKNEAGTIPPHTYACISCTETLIYTCL